MSVLVFGSIALDTVKTPVEEHSDLIGGSASYAALSASFFSPVRLVGVVGEDFPESEFEFWKERKIDIDGVQRANGKTFRWSGEYSLDLNTRQTRSIALNVFKHFEPVLPKAYRQSDFVLLANIAPSLQAHVLDQMERPRFVVADTMDLWIETTRSDLDALLRRVDLLILNESEAREMTKETSLIKAGRRIRKFGPRYVAIKKGEHGALLFGEGDQFFSCGAISAGRHSRSDRCRGHVCRWHGGILGRHREKSALQRSAQSDDLRERAGEFLRRSIQFGASARSNDG